MCELLIIKYLNDWVLYFPYYVSLYLPYYVEVCNEFAVATSNNTKLTAVIRYANIEAIRVQYLKIIYSIMWVPLLKTLND